ncbi:MAG: hypothetical protein K9J12_03875 [Melioribacteraceae bacterium]|nr:hypothetical protein [Melioribacteraceae bacterium]MCF8263238.1 hypothetical protein [Melioribacteraceae bacterium]MCF8412212.1 hypothetical protein [Melioribacteraceae bacterium]MCF8431026.1 hypothetical protein [Melioribacteraceae bacterium]
MKKLREDIRSFFDEPADLRQDQKRKKVWITIVFSVFAIVIFNLIMYLLTNGNSY